MDLAELARWEWMVMLLIPLALAIRELISIRRILRRTRAAEQDPKS